MATGTSVFLGEYETKTLLELEVRGPGIYRTKMMVRCNSLLSSLFVRAADAGATVKVNYFDTTTGDETTPERYDLDGHDLADATFAGKTERILVTQIHNKPQIEVIVTGGNVEFGVYATAVPASASALDQSLVDHLQVADLTRDKALIMAGYDPVTGLFSFLPIEDGAVKVTGSLSVVVGGVTTGLNTTVTTDAAPNTETSLAMVSIKRFRVTNRGRVGVKYAFTALESGTNYATLMPNATLSEDGLLSATVTLYIQAPSASQRLEVVTWT